MSDRKGLHAQARAFFDGLWKQGDYWALERSPFEQAKYARQLALLGDGRYPRALEIGCGAGVFTHRLARLADRVVAIDISQTAIAQAQAAHRGADGVSFRVADIMEHEVGAEGPWDLVVMSETIYYLGWLHTFFDVAWLASELLGATRPGGRFLMANTYGEMEDYLVRPWVIHTYRDLFVNVGFRIEHEEVFQGTKDGVELEVLISLFRKNDAGATASAPADAGGGG